MRFMPFLVRRHRRAAGLFPVLSAVLAVALSGCADQPPRRAAGPTMIASLNGEPLSGGPLGRPSCGAALGGWFDRVDTNHDGVLGADEFLADAAAQFARMDKDGDGFITAAELQVFRLPFRPAHAGQAPGGEGRAGSRGEAPPGRGSGGPRPPKATLRDAATPSGEPPDPVMSADVNLDFRVSQDEFMTQAKQVLSQNDANHDGRLDRNEVLTRCDEAPMKSR